MANEKKTTSIEDMKIDVSNLYREETITDLKVGSIQRLVPVKADGTEDETRKPRYVAQTQVLTQMGALPIHAPVDAASLKEATEKFSQAVRDEIERLRDMAQRQQIADAGRGVVLPQGGQGGLAGPGAGGGNIIV